MDRQDIDALLIGALYGELTPADEARLAAHLESHPADRGALDDLKVARQAIHDSRIFAVQLDPPQAVSALLLQEAHRRAPKVARDAGEKEGWFARFARSFMAHPAMAAAAMLVLVMGGAGIVWMKKGDQFADKEYAPATATAERAETTQVAMTPDPVLPEGNAAVAAGSAYSAGLYEGEAPAAAADQGADRLEEQARAREQASQEKRAMSLEVTTDRAPKDLDEAKAVAKNDRYDDALAADKAATSKPAAKPSPKRAAPGRSADGMGTGGGGAAGTASATGSTLDFAGESANAVSGAGYAQPPPPAPTTTSTSTRSTAKVATDSKQAPAQNAPATKAPAKAPAKESKPAPPPAITAAPAAPTPNAEPAPAPAEKKAEAKPDNTAWAKSEHQRAVALAKAGKCQAAAQVAVSVSNRASAYYSQYMATDRSLKACAQYINAERDKEAERSQKARAQKRVNADEPASTTK